MDKTLVEIETEIKELEQKRQKENMNRINAFGVIFRIQDELGGSIFGINFSKDIYEYDNEAYDKIVYTLLEKINSIEKIYQNSDKYLPKYTERETYGLSKEKFTEYSEEIRNVLKTIKVSNSKLDNIFNKEIELGKLKSAKLDEKNTKDSIPAVKVQIDNLKEEIEKLENDVKLNEGLMNTAPTDEIKNLYANVITSTKKLIAGKKSSITKLHKIVSKEDITYYEKVEEEEKQKELERKLALEKEKLEEEKRSKLADVKERRKIDKINKEFDEALYGNTKEEEEENFISPQEALDEQLKVDTAAESPKKPKLITRANEVLKKVINRKNKKAIAILVASAALLTGGIALAPSALIGAVGATGAYFGYKEIKKGMGK